MEVVWVQVWFLLLLPFFFDYFILFYLFILLTLFHFIILFYFFIHVCYLCIYTFIHFISFLFIIFVCPLVNGVLKSGHVDSTSIQSLEVWTGTTYALAATMLSVGMQQVRKLCCFEIY
jgi:hypothetical protein